MPRKITTLMLENAACVGGVAQTIEKALREVPGVLHAYVNPATEAAYVEYDSDRCSEAELDAAVRSVGIDALPTVPGAHNVVPVAFLPRRFLMRQNGTGSRTWWVFAGFVVIAAFILLTGQRASLLGALPFLFLLACPLLHRLGHGAHGAHGSHSGNGNRDSSAASVQEGIARDRDRLTQNRNGHHASPLPPVMPATRERRRSQS